jgi:SAM-dependent methyltransferase
MPPIHVESAVEKRYSQAAARSEAALCCPIHYDPRLLEAIPAEVIEKDYGCGDPSKWLRAGETVLDLGSGTGKIAFIAAQVVGPAGRVIGVDMTDAMLEVARRNTPIVAGTIGYTNVEFRKGRIQDLQLDLDALDSELAGSPISGAGAFLQAQGIADRLRRERPLVADASVDVVVSNCVLNLVDSRDKAQLFREIARVLRAGGRAVISDIVSDEDIPDALQHDAQLWSGCLSGALREDLFIRAFEEAGLVGVRILERDATPWQTVEGIEFRSITIEAFKLDVRPEQDRLQAVIYRGPFREVVDDAGRRFRRGDRIAVSDRVFEALKLEPFAAHFIPVPPHESAVTGSLQPAPEPATPTVPNLTAPASIWQEMPLRPARKSKGEGFRLTTPASNCCGGGTCA